MARGKKGASASWNPVTWILVFLVAIVLVIGGVVATVLLGKKSGGGNGESGGDEGKDWWGKAWGDAKEWLLPGEDNEGALKNAWQLFSGWFS